MAPSEQLSLGITPGEAPTRVWLESYGVWAEGSDVWSIWWSGDEENIALLEEDDDAMEHAYELAARKIVKQRRITDPRQLREFPPAPPLRSLRNDLVPAQRVQHRGSSGRPRTAGRRRTARATARAGPDDPEPEPAPPRVALTDAERAYLRAEVDRRARKQAKAWDKLAKAVLRTRAELEAQQVAA